LGRDKLKTDGASLNQDCISPPEGASKKGTYRGEKERVNSFNHGGRGRGTCVERQEDRESAIKKKPTVAKAGLRLMRAAHITVVVDPETRAYRDPRGGATTGKAGRPDLLRKGEGRSKEKKGNKTSFMSANYLCRER